MYNALDENAVLEGVKRFGPAPGARKMMDAEMLHAMEAIESGTYITYWFEKKKIECGRLGSTSKCFCGHLMSSHNDKYFGKKFDVSCKDCPCKVFKFVPTRPEECGMYWLPRRKDFNVHKWRAPCKCNHNHEEHQPNYPLRCSKCTNCPGFRAYFACISCDGAWEDHEVLYETEMERKQLGKNIRDAYKPLSAHGAIQHEVFEVKDRPVDPALVRPRPAPGTVDRVPFMPMFRVKPAQLTTGADGKKTFQPPSSQFTFLDGQEQQQVVPSHKKQPSFNPVYDDIPVGGANTGAKMGFNPVYDDIPVGRPSQQASTGGSTGGAKMGFNPIYDDDKYANKQPTATKSTNNTSVKPAASSSVNSSKISTKSASTTSSKSTATTTTSGTRNQPAGKAATTTINKYK